MSIAIKSVAFILVAVAYLTIIPCACLGILSRTLNAIFVCWCDAIVILLEAARKALEETERQSNA